MMATTMRDEIRVGEMAIRFLVEGEESGGSRLAVFEFEVPTGTKVAAAHSHDGYEETIYGLEGVLTGRSQAGRSMSDPDRRFSFHAASSTSSTTQAMSMRTRWPS